LLNNNKQTLITKVPSNLNPSVQSIGWPVVYSPKGGFISSQNGGPDSFTFHVVDNSTDISFPDAVVRITVKAVNQAPTFTGTSQASLNSVGVSSWKIFGMVVSDDSQGTTNALNVTVQLVGTNPPGSVKLDTNLTTFVQNYTVISSKFFTFKASVTVMNFVFGSGGGITYSVASIGFSGTDTMRIVVNDLGFEGEEVPPVPKNGTSNISIVFSPTDGNGSPGSVAVSLVGVTTLLGAAVTGIYRIMKKKNMLPETIDPWETDEVFDDSTMYSGSTSSVSAVLPTSVN